MKNDKLEFGEEVLYILNLKLSYASVLEESKNNKLLTSTIIFYFDLEDVFLNCEIFSIIRQMELSGFTLFASQSKDFKIELYNKYKLERYSNQKVYTIYEFSELFISFILSHSVGSLIKLSNNFYQEINTANIPQFSNFDNASINLTKTLIDCGDFGPDFVKLGKYLTDKGKNTVAYRKYGENHSKLSCLLGLSLLDLSKRPNRVYLTHLGSSLSKLDIEKQKEITIKLCIQIPIISISLKEAQENKIYIRKKMLQYLSETTVNRRISNVMYIFDKINKYSKENFVSEIFKNIAR